MGIKVKGFRWVGSLWAWATKSLDAADVLAFGGLICIGVGVALMHVPAALIVFGLGLGYLGLRA